MLLRLIALGGVALLGNAVEARGVSPYLPLQMSPEIERQIERLLILADQPVLQRPIAAATVLSALPRACERDVVLCQQVERYLSGYMRTAGIPHASLTAAATSSDSIALANRHGMRSDSAYEASISAYFQPSDYVLLSGGVLAYEGETTPTGTLVSMGFEYAQVDVGFRDHWLSPFTDSSMALSTEAATMPSVTISNYTPLTRWRLRYEFFVAEMSESSNIAFQGGFTSGNPLFGGIHVSIEPFDGWSFGVTRLLQFGGGERDSSLEQFPRRAVQSVRQRQHRHGCRFRQSSRLVHVSALVAGARSARALFRVRRRRHLDIEQSAAWQLRAVRRPARSYAGPTVRSHGRAQ